MSKNFAISIAIAMVMSVAAVTTVSAQNVKYEISASDFEACVAYLSTHKGDTIREMLPSPVLELVAPADTTVTRNEGLTTIALQKGDKLYRIAIDVVWGERELPRGYRYQVERVNVLPPVLVADSSEVKRVDRKAEKTQVNLIAQSYGQEQDIYFYEASVHETTNGKIVDRFNNKNGLRLVAGPGYRLGQGGIHSFTAEAGFELTFDSGFFTRGTYRFATAKHPGNAVDANGSYTTHGLRPAVGFRKKLDTYGQWYVGLSAGPGFDYQKCETQKNQNGLLQSNVFVVYPFVDAEVSYEPFGSRWGFTFKIGWEQSQILTQNDGNSGKNVLETGFLVKYRL